MNALHVLERFVQGQHRAAEAARCELCADRIPERHRHVVDLADRRLLCACRACAVLFTDRMSGRLRAVPERVRIDPSWKLIAQDLDALGVPVGLAFFFRPSRLGRWMAVFPSPGGATEAELPHGAFSELEQRPLVRSIEDDVEALLVRRAREGGCTTFVVPIDVCYELVALLRRHWKGIDGGDDARRALDEFFVQLAMRSEPKPAGRATSGTPFRRARRIADTILLEGYLLYPYRADTTKNRYRWTFGVVAPRSWSEPGGCEPWWLEAQVLVESARPRLRGRLRFLRVVKRRIEALEGEAFCAVPRLDVAGRLWVPWEEGELREIDFSVAHNAGDGDVLVPFSVAAYEDVEPLEDASGKRVGQVVRARSAIHGAIHVHVELVGTSEQPLSRVSVCIENLTPYPADRARAEAMRVSCIATHLLLASDDGGFVSTVDPPFYAENAASACKSVGTHPVLAGAPGAFDLMLCSPIILDDHPHIAPESPGDFFDATAAGGWGASPKFARGQRVRLRPKAKGPTRRTDAQDLLYAGYCATIEAILEDVDGREYLAVTIDDDPEAELHRWYGRFHHYYPEEVELL